MGPRSAIAPGTTPSAARSSQLAHQNRYQSGRSAEQAVARFLVERGYELIATNLRLSYLELDVVARQADVIIVVEVRARGARSWTSGFGSLDGRKRHRIRLAGARLWERRYVHDPSVNRLRFDAASVRFTPHGVEIEYVEGAF